jgi:TrmH family RNA methyltransferase
VTRRISSRDNPLVQRVRRLTRDPGAYRALGEVWLEGEHLCGAFCARGGQAAVALCSDSAWAQPGTAALVARAAQSAVLPDALFAQLSPLPSPAGIGLLAPLPGTTALERAAATVVLDRLQDAGNVGSILRSASAFGVRQVLALRGTAGLWSPKVLRAAMGAHFGLHLHEGMDAEALRSLDVPLVATSSHAAASVAEAALPWPCAWIFGHEGQGIDPALLPRCAVTVRIPQPGGEESLNVAAAAAVCLYESVRRAAGGS